MCNGKTTRLDSPRGSKSDAEGSRQGHFREAEQKNDEEVEGLVRLRLDFFATLCFTIGLRNSLCTRLRLFYVYILLTM